ncbi:MAG: DivIVA domain-containing protein [Clostridium sp.]|nr:DivIVA domain-containing protein [Clostridium sp.]
MITPSQIREKKISTVSTDGYDRNEVNALLVDIIESYEAVCEENKELYRKMEILANRIEEYREDEDSIKTAIISAQKIAHQVTADAKEKAEKTISESAASAQQTVQDAKEKADKIIGEAREYVANLTKEKAQAADEIISDAQKKANDAIAKAKEITDDLVIKAKNEANHHKDVIDKLKTESKNFKSTLISLYETQLTHLKDIAAGTDSSSNVSVEEVESELDNIIADMDTAIEESTDSAPAEEAEEQAAFEVIQPDEAEADEAEEIEEIEEIEEAEESEEEFTISSVDDKEDEVDEIIDQINLMDIPDEEPEEKELPTEQEVASALDAFTQDEITPVADNSASIPEIEEEPEFESVSMPFENYFNVDKTDPKTNETISLTAPDEEDDDEGSSKFRGFFKKKK